MENNSSGLRRVKITDEIRKAYEERDKSLDNADPDATVMPPEFWANATIGRFYRPIETPVSVRTDADVLDWLKSAPRKNLPMSKSPITTGTGHPRRPDRQ